MGLKNLDARREILFWAGHDGLSLPSKRLWITHKRVKPRMDLSYPVNIAVVLTDSVRKYRFLTKGNNEYRQKE